ncbi:MAG: AI-2E family transporter, partial [Lachnospiraceae bacterium]|nr:AI-2E family transporter [Lachnospiraceae bacterium]
MNKKYTTIAIYIVITAVIIMTAGELIINYKNIFGLIGGLWELLWTVFRPATIGFAIAYLLFPVVKKLNGFFMLFEKSINKRNPEVRSHWALSVATTWFLVLAGISAVLTVLVSTVTENVKFVSIIEMSKAAETIVLATEDFYRKALQFLGTLNIAASDVDAVLKNFGETAIGWFQNASNNFAGSVSSVVSSMGTLLFSIIFSIYFMVDGDNILNYWKRVLQILLPEKIYTGIGMVIEDADRCFSGYIRGQIADAIIMAVIFSVVLSIIKVPYAVVIGIIS